MREIKFRGKSIGKEDKWIYGFLTKGKNWQTEKGYYLIQHSDIESTQIIPETVGQYIGLKDKNNKEIYEGDICKIKVNNNKEIIEEIKWKEYRWYPFGEGVPPNYTGTEIEVIRNIYENKELLEGKE